MADVDVKTRLKLDDAASAALQKIKGGFKETSKEAESAKQSAMEFGRQVAAVAIGTALPGIIRGAKDMATSFLKATNAAYDQEQALAGVYATLAGMPWDDARREAEKMRRELLDMATEIGQAPDEVYKGFQKLLSFVGKGTDESFRKVQKQTEQLTILANVMGHSVETIAMEFGAMHDGVVRTRGPLAQILKTTGVFGDNMAEAVTMWRKLSQVQREAKLAEALETQAKKIGKATPTISDLINTFANMKQLFIEELGAPVIRALLPVMKDLKDQLKAVRPQIEAFALTMGKDLARSVQDGAKLLKEGFEYVRTHSDEIREAIYDGAKTIKEAFKFAYNTIKFLLDNKETIMAMWAGSKALGAAGGVGGVGRGARAAGRGAMALGGAIGGGGGGAALGGVQTVASVAGLAALSAAIVGVGAAAWQASKLYEEQWGDASEEALNAFAKMKRAEEAYRNGDIQAAKDWAMQAQAQGDKGRQISMKMLRDIANRQSAEDKLRRDLEDAVKESNLADAIEVYNTAVMQGNEKMQKMAAETITSSDKLSAALKDGKHKIVGGMESLTKATEEQFTDWQRAMDEMLRQIGEGSDALSKQMLGLGKGPSRVAAGRAAREAARKARRAVAGGTSINVNKLEIKQEFRDQDPDRVVIAFKKDIIKHATRRLQSRRATIFGV